MAAFQPFPYSSVSVENDTSVEQRMKMAWGRWSCKHVPWHILAGEGGSDLLSASLGRQALGALCVSEGRVH